MSTGVSEDSVGGWGGVRKEEARSWGGVEAVPGMGAVVEEVLPPHHPEEPLATHLLGGCGLSSFKGQKSASRVLSFFLRPFKCLCEGKALKYHFIDMVSQSTNSTCQC